MTYNIHIVSITNRMVRYMEEIQGFQSANGAEMHEEDLDRLKSYIDGMRVHLESIQSRKKMDYVETNADLEPLRPMPPKVEMENESLNDINMMLRRSYKELVNCASSRQGSKLNKYDEGRLKRTIDEITDFIKDYVEVVTPLDMPNSSPRVPAVSEGKVGI